MQPHTQQMCLGRVGWEDVRSRCGGWRPLAHRLVENVLSPSTNSFTSGSLTANDDAWCASRALRSVDDDAPKQRRNCPDQGSGRLIARAWHGMASIRAMAAAWGYRAWRGELLLLTSYKHDRTLEEHLRLCALCATGRLATPPTFCQSSLELDTKSPP